MIQDIQNVKKKMELKLTIYIHIHFKRLNSNYLKRYKQHVWTFANQRQMKSLSTYRRPKADKWESCIMRL